MLSRRIVGDQLKPITLSLFSFGNVVAILTGILFWLIQIFGPASWTDGFNVLVIITSAILFATRKSFMGMAIICGYLAGSLQGIVIAETEIKDGMILTTTLTSLILSILLVTANGRFLKNDIKFLIYASSIPATFAAASFVLSDYYFIFSEFKKFVMFFAFLTIALTVEHAKQKELLRLTVNAVFAILLFAIFAFFTLGVEFDYGGLRYPAIPPSILLLPLLYMVHQSKILLFYTLFIVLIFLLGFLQPSAKLLIILFCFVIMEVRKLSISSLLLFVTLFLVFNFVSFQFDTMMNHKIFSLVFSFGSILEIATSGEVSNASIFFHTSVGNIVAEFFTVFGLLVENFFLPLGAGFVTPDLYGWLSFANDAAYHPLSKTDAKYPLHLGFYYLMIWYGPLIVIFHNFRKILIFLISFSLFSLSAPSLVFLAAILSTKDSNNIPESILPKSSSSIIRD
jgi:hypothetical protein